MTRRRFPRRSDYAVPCHEDAATTTGARAPRAMSAPISPAPVSGPGEGVIPAYLSNGLLGLRATRIPMSGGVCMVSGLVGRDPIAKVEAFARAPYPIAGDIAIDGVRLSERPARVEVDEQRYDFGCGELRTRLRLRGDGVEARVDVVTFCSRTQPTLIVQRTRVEVTAECGLEMSAGVDPAGIAGGWRLRSLVTPGSTEPMVDGYARWDPHGAFTGCGIAYVTRFDGGDGLERHVEDLDETGPIRTVYAVRARPGRAYVLDHVASLMSSQAHQQPELQAHRQAWMGADVGVDKLRDDNRAAWTTIWDGRVRLLGAEPRWQAITDASYYYLQASAHASSLFSTAMFGLAYWPNYHYYRGHVMWDIEAFAFPPLLLTEPATARSLLSYRYDRIPAARRLAALNGLGGLQFPWESSPLAGEELYRVDAPMLGFEQHVSFSVALAFARFVHVTGDREFAETSAWPVLKGVADWIESRGTATGRGIEFHRVLGVAEKQEPVHNNAFFNMAAAVTLREAACLARMLGRPEARRWGAMSDDVFVPVDAERGVIVNVDEASHGESTVDAATPEALGGLLLPFDYQADPELERATIADQLARVGPFVGMPMLSAPLGYYAARLGDRRLSAELFQAGYGDFVDGPFLVGQEFSRTRFPENPPAGPLFANLGGFLSSLMVGLTGLRIGPGDPAGWAEREVVMPDGWDGVELERVWLRGRPARITATHGAERAAVHYLD
jgi:trehalose/maltose hydrolase-like predicted phosphorylase